MALSRTLAVFLFVLFLALFIGDIVFFVEEIRLGTGSASSPQSEDTPVVWASAPLISFGDMTLAFTLVFILYRQRSQISFTRTASMVNRIMMYTIGTGLLTAVFALVGFVAALTMKHSLVWLAVFEVLPKCELSSLATYRLSHPLPSVYLNCMLTSYAPVSHVPMKPLTDILIASTCAAHYARPAQME